MSLLPDHTLSATRYLARMVSRTGYWYSWDTLTAAVKEFTAILYTQKDRIIQTGVPLVRHSNGLGFLYENMGYHYPYSLIQEKEMQSLPSSVKELIGSAHRSEDLYSALFDFKIEALNAVLACLENGVPAAALKDQAFTFLTKIAAYSETLDVFNGEIELMATDFSVRLFGTLREPLLKLSPPHTMSSELFSPVSGGGPRGNIGMCGTVAVLLFLSRELATRSIDSIYNACTDISSELAYPLFHCMPQGIMDGNTAALEEQNRNALTFLAAYETWKEETREEILDITRPDEPIELNLPFIMTRKNFETARSRLKNFIQEHREIFDTGSVLYELYRARGTALRPPLEIEEDQDRGGWVFRYKKKEVHVPPRFKGAAYLAALIKHPGTDIPAYRLQEDRGDYTDSLEQLVREAELNSEETRSFLEELKDLEILISEGGSEAAGVWKEALAMREELIGSLVRRREEAVEKIAKKSGDAVQKTLRRVISFIGESDRELATYLELHIRTGITLSYIV
ncbi:MAG: hypothetical protein JXB03_01925 [Spirochaetales bacterium]|nr:hypothetical protein [Spirochaetales bacterium]